MEWRSRPASRCNAPDLVEKKQAVKQLDLFSFEKDAIKEPLLDTIEQLRKKYGETIIENACEHTEGIEPQKNTFGD